MITKCKPAPQHKLSSSHRPWQGLPSTYSSEIASVFQSPVQIRAEVERDIVAERTLEVANRERTIRAAQEYQREPFKARGVKRRLRYVTRFFASERGRWVGVRDETAKALVGAGYPVRTYSRIPTKQLSGVLVAISEEVGSWSA